MTSIYSWNVNGIRAVVRKGTFQTFIKDHSPDILCLQETKAMQGEAVLDLPDYTEYWNSAQKKGYSGTAIFSKEKPLSVVNDIPEKFAQAAGLVADDYGSSNHEGRVIAAEFKDFYVVGCYTVNAKDDLSRIPLRQKWDDAIIAYCKHLQTKKPVVYCGDMNVAHTPDDLARPKENEGMKGFTPEERAGFDAFVKAGYTDTFRMFHQGNGHYSWWSNWANARARNVGWRIDYVMASKDIAKKVTKATIHADVLGSDHCPVSIELKI